MRRRVDTRNTSLKSAHVYYGASQYTDGSWSFQYLFASASELPLEVGTKEVGTKEEFLPTFLRGSVCFSLITSGGIEAKAYQTVAGERPASKNLATRMLVRGGDPVRRLNLHLPALLARLSSPYTGCRLSPTLQGCSMLGFCGLLDVLLFTLLYKRIYVYIHGIRPELLVAPCGFHARKGVLERELQGLQAEAPRELGYEL